MNRMEEYQTLLNELEILPEELETTAERAVTRENTSRKKRRSWTVSFGSLAACFAGFVLLVNCFPTFAKACGNIPVLSALAEAVSFSKSLSAAVEHDYAQVIGQSQTENGITASVEYVIVDRKQVSIFYALDSDTVEQLEADYDIQLPNELHGYSSSTGSYGQKNGELRRIDVDFMEIDVPDTLELSLSAYSNGQKVETAAPAESLENSRFETPGHDPKYLAEFTFTLEFDPYFTAQGEIIPVNAPFILDGQKFTLTEVELYPTHLRVNIDDAEGNTAWLKGLDLYLENERGERFENSVSGISASGDPDGEGYATFWLDSPFFSQGEHLTLYITRARWSDKEAPQVRLDLKNGTAENLPDFTRFLKAEKHPEGWVVYFAMPREPGGGMYNLFSGSFWDEEGQKYDIRQSSNTFGIEGEEAGERSEWDTMFTESFPLANFHGDVAYLEPHYNRITDFETPVSIIIK